MPLERWNGTLRDGGGHVAEAAGARETAEFAALLREFKDRSGLSYGALAKRLHMSTSSLHRYCQGTAVPSDYAPVERLARVCRATPPELVELHRRWVLADAARASRGDQAASRVPAEDAPRTAGAVTEADTPQRAEGVPAHDPVRSAAARGRDADGEADEADEARGAGAADGAEGVEETLVSHAEREPVTSRRRRTAWVASAAVAAVLAAAVLVTNPPWKGDGRGAGDQPAADTVASSGTADAKEPTTAPSTAQAPTQSASASSSGTPSPSRGGGATQRSGTPAAAAGPSHGSDTADPPITFRTRPYVYDDPCSQHFLVNSAPQQVGPPADEETAPRWAAVYGAVSSGEQRVALTVQGTGAQTVVLEALHVSVVSRGAPLAWNDYSMGVGCGGGVESASFDIDLDRGSPAVTAKNGQRDFPYKVSESDPEVFYVTAHSKAHDVRWELTLDWSSGERHGTVRIDNAGAPFRTSADANRPGYDYPLGSNDWIERVD